MNKKITRRRALGVLGSVTTAAAASLAGVFPEIQIGRASSSGMPDRPGVLRHLTGERLAARFSAAQTSARGRLARAFLARRGFVGQPLGTEAAELALDDGTEIGHVVAALFHDPRADRYARLTHQTSGDRLVTGVAIWSAAEPLRREVYDLRGSGFQLSATLVGAPNGSLVIERPDGTRLPVPARPGTTMKGGPGGLARPLDQPQAAEYCNYFCVVVFDFVCTAVLIETCVISAICGPLAILCAGACVVSVLVSCFWNATNYCSWSCSWISGVTEQTGYA